MKMQILIEILFMLLSRDKVSARYIADKFGISIRTVYRYIDDLSIPVPIYNTRGRYGGFSIADSFKIQSTFLSEEEKNYLIGVLKTVDKEVDSDMLKRIINRLGSIVNREKESAPLNLGNIIIDGSAWGSNDEYKQTLTLIQKCIENNTSLNISYVDRDGEVTERIIEPHTILLKQGLWYCYAYCNLRGEFRLFKIARISRAKITSDTFTRKDIGNVEEVFAEWYQTLETIDIDVELDESARYDVEEWLGVGSVFVDSNGKTKASFKAPYNKDVVSKILSFGNKVQVLRPFELRKEVASALKDALKLYE